MQFLYPNILFLLIFIVVLIFLVSVNKDNMSRFFSKDTLKKMQVENNGMGNLSRNILFFAILVLFVLALARPVMNMKEQKIKQKRIPIVIALDVSKSMMATDIYPNRISLAKKKLKLILERSKNSIIGILLFAKDSFIVSPITEDFTSLKYIIDNLDTSLNFTNGSNIFAVLEATNQMLQDYKVKNLIILSDGGNNNKYKDELEFALKNEISIYTIGLATSNGAPIPDGSDYLTDVSGNIVTVSLNESIKNLALNSNGGYIGFSLDSNDVEAILNQINKQSNREELDSQNVKLYTELFYYPLVLAILLLLISLSSLPNFKKYIASLLFVNFICYPTTQYAGILDFKTLENAKENYNNKKYKEAISNYQKINVSNQRDYNLANSYYKDKQFEKAIETYKKIQTDDVGLKYKKLHNLGNSYAKNNNLKQAKTMYEKALELKDDIQTKENIEIIKKMLKQKKKNKKDKKDQDNKNKKDKKDQDKKNNKDKKDQDNKNKQDKKDQDKKNNKDKKDQDNKNNKDKKDQDNKNKKDKKEHDKKKGASKIEQKKIDEEYISSMEEKKWIKQLQNKKIPIMLQRVKTKKYNNKVEQPW
ncbi:BatC [hydrothermal vent metagenome]|uniref:BatC n=1 Tax=hydrothermal vent metagenome TaxID=652676 RepID=A0A3B1E6G2_9ZZZZ